MVPGVFVLPCVISATSDEETLLSVHRFPPMVIQFASLAVSAAWGLLLYVAARFSWTHHDAGKQARMDSLSSESLFESLSSLYGVCAEIR